MKHSKRTESKEKAKYQLPLNLERKTKQLSS